MTDDIRRWREALKDMPRRAEQVTEGLGDDQLNWRPEKGRWSIAQCLDHLNRANGKIVAQMEAGIEKAKASGGTKVGPWKPGFLERFFIRAVGANAPFKSPVPPDFVPGERASREEVLPEFHAVHERYLACLDEVEKSGLLLARIASPVSKLVKCTLGTWFAATVEHDNYHLGQADQSRKELDAHISSSS
jgi:hypothetical protein